MKASIIRLVIIVAAVSIFGLTRETQARTRVNISVFYSALAPYGEWIEYRDYGLCWRPTIVEAGWRPYTHGRWIWTDYGWTWVSDYEWGWAPFHYGRWINDDYYGWIWVPDDVWGPAWVQWRFSDAYIGWAPLPPTAAFQVGIGVSFTDYFIPHYGWSFTYCSGFVGSRLVFLPVTRNIIILRETRIIHGITYQGSRVFNRGPRVDFIERVSGARVRKVNVVDHRNFGERRGTSSFGGNRLEGDRLYVYRPDLKSSRQEKSVNRPEQRERLDRREQFNSEQRSEGRQFRTRDREERVRGIEQRDQNRHDRTDRGEGIKNESRDNSRSNRGGREGHEWRGRSR